MNEKIFSLNKKLLAVGLVLILVAGSVLVYLFYFEEEREPLKIQKPIEEIKVDDQISPYTNQGLMIEIQRIRHRGLMDKMLKFGMSWRNTPSFYWKTYVDGDECNSKGNVGQTGVYNQWDSFGEESVVSYYIEEEQANSEVIISIFEVEKKGILKLRSEDIERETITLQYDYRTGRWNGDDYFKDKDGYGHYLGENFEVWFNIYQSDYDHDGISYWTEVNILGTDPAIDDSKLDPDNDGIPTSWEWKWGYDPFTYDDHENLDPDVDGIENIEEYQMRKYFSNPYQPDIYIETDGMKKKGLIDFPHVFPEEAQQMIIERFAQYGINVYIDDGWVDGPINGGGEMLPFYENLDDVVAKQTLSFYNHHFSDERKGIFRYVIIGNKHSGFTNPGKYVLFDMIHVGTDVEVTLKTRLAFTPRFFKVAIAKTVLHELGHTLGLVPIAYPGNDIMGPIGVRYPSMDEEDYERYLKEYHSIMNYRFIYHDRTLFDFSDGSNGEPYDQNDWDYIYIPTFQIDQISYEEPKDESFEDFEVSDEYPGILLEGWKYDENLTEKYREDIRGFTTVKNTDIEVKIYKKIDADKDCFYDVKAYVKPKVDPTHAVWTLVKEGKSGSKHVVDFYSQSDIIENIKETI